PPPASPLLPYTTLFRSQAAGARGPAAGEGGEPGRRGAVAGGDQRGRGSARLRLSASPSGLPGESAIGELSRRACGAGPRERWTPDRKSTRLNSSHVKIS